MSSSKVTYRQQFTRCGKQRCRKCKEGSGHGPYWYAYWSEKGRTVSKYIGTSLPGEIEKAEQGEEERAADVAVVTQAGMPGPSLRIYLLGQFRIERKNDGEWRTLDSRTWHRRRARALLGCLLSNAGRRLGREQVMEMLWPDLDIDLAANRLNGAVHELRQMLEPDIARPAASRMLRLERDVLELADSTQIWVDAEEFEHLLKEADATSNGKQAELQLEQAAKLYRGSYLLEELYSEWATPRRDALQRAWVGLLLKMANVQAGQKAYVSAIETLDRLRTADPTNETVLQRLMILLTQLDRRGEALQIYRQHVAMLQRDYEGEPLPETSTLYETLRKGNRPPLYTYPTQTDPVQIEKATEEKLGVPNAVTEKIQKVPIEEISLARPVFQLGRHNQSPLIGRDRELERLQRVMLSTEGVTTSKNSSTPQPPGEQANTQTIRPALQTSSSSSRPRHTHFLLLKGEAGIGKTRLAEELSIQAYTRGWTVAWSRSYEQEGTIPYHPWTDLLRTLLPSTTTFAELIHTETGTQNGQQNVLLKIERLSALLPELIHYTVAPGTRSTLAIPHEQERLHLWEATLALLEVFSKFRPMLLVLDDLHWVDDSSIELLTYLIHHLRDQRVLIVGTCRDGELTPQHKLRNLVTDLQREQAIAIVSVLPLTSSQIGSLVAHLPEEVVQSIQTKAAGNPFFAEELARFMGTTYNEKDLLAAINSNEQGKSAAHTRIILKSVQQKIEHETLRPQRSLPEAIAAVLERRLSQLSNGCQLLLGKVAVLGGSFELSQLLPMATEHNEDTVLDLLEEALRAGLLTEEGTGANITYHFWHPLIINHLYSRLSAARRAQLHRKAAEAIKAAHPGQPEKAAAIVYHLSKGGGDRQTVANYAEIAGNQAYSLAAFSEAQQYYLQAVQALANSEFGLKENNPLQTHMPPITTQTLSLIPLTELVHVCRLLEHIGRCSMVLGNYDNAQYVFGCILDLRTSQNFQRQLHSAIGTNEEKRQQEAQIQALIWREISIAWSLTGEYERAYASYERGKKVLIEAGITRGAAWGCLHRQYAVMLRLQGKYYEARRYLQETLEILEQVVQQPAEQTLKDTAGSRQGLYKDPQTRSERLLNGDPLEIGYVHEGLGIIAASLGQLNAALKSMHTALTIYEQSELISEMARVCSNLGAVYMTKGEHEAARKYMNRSLELAERAGDVPNMAFVMLNLGEVAQRTGDLLEAERLFKQSLALTEQVNFREGISWCCTMLSTVQKAQGNLKEAIENILHAINIGRAIKNTRCIRFALIWLADLRITQAISFSQMPYTVNNESQQQYSQRMLKRAKATLERILVLEGIEVEYIVDGKLALASVYFMLGDLEIAQQMAWQTCQESQEYAMTSASERIYRLLGLINTAQGDYIQADRYFEQAIEICQERGFRLDYAKTCHSYGASLIQRGIKMLAQPGRSSAIARQAAQKSTDQRGREYLYEARSIFAACHAAVDLELVEQDLAMLKD